jgi:hypothetical protein
VSLWSGESIKGKHDSEKFVLQHGVRIKAYRADNHPFNSAQFRQDFNNKDQEMALQNEIFKPSPAGQGQ